LRSAGEGETPSRPDEISVDSIAKRPSDYPDLFKGIENAPKSPDDGLYARSMHYQEWNFPGTNNAIITRNSGDIIFSVNPETKDVDKAFETVDVLITPDSKRGEGHYLVTGTLRPASHKKVWENSQKNSTILLTALKNMARVFNRHIVDSQPQKVGLQPKNFIPQVDQSMIQNGYIAPVVIMNGTLHVFPDYNQIKSKIVIPEEILRKAERAANISQYPLQLSKIKILKILKISEDGTSFTFTADGNETDLSAALTAYGDTAAAGQRLLEFNDPSVTDDIKKLTRSGSVYNFANLETVNDDGSISVRFMVIGQPVIDSKLIYPETVNELVNLPNTNTPSPP
jgi:hypothetical protein